jgi:hypothetical protein
MFMIDQAVTQWRCWHSVVSMRHQSRCVNGRCEWRDRAPAMRALVAYEWGTGKGVSGFFERVWLEVGHAHAPDGLADRYVAMQVATRIATGASDVRTGAPETTPNASGADYASPERDHVVSLAGACNVSVGTPARTSAKERILSRVLRGCGPVSWWGRT